MRISFVIKYGRLKQKRRRKERLTTFEIVVFEVEITLGRDIIATNLHRNQSATMWLPSILRRKKPFWENNERDQMETNS